MDDKINTWHNLDDLGFERSGLPRNLFFASIAIAFVLYQIIDLFMKRSGTNSVLPIPLAIGIWHFFLVPTMRDMNDRLPKGYWRGMYFYYMNNPGHLQIINDPEPMPLYIKDSTKQAYKQAKPGKTKADRAT